MSAKRADHRRLQIERFEPRLLLATDSIYISEFLANNDSGLADEDGQFSDWIELHNPTAHPINLSGWSLTDSAADLQKWTFPPIEISALDYLVVYASGKNRRLSNQKLHTNFRLSSEGEYLALVNPEQAVIHDFQPTYPAQSSDQSFGFPSVGVPLVSEDTPYVYYQPQGIDAEDVAWRDELSYDDSSWLDGNGGIGFDLRRRDTVNVGFETGRDSDWQTRGSVRVIDRSSGWQPTEGNYLAIASTRGSTATGSGLEFAMRLPSGSLKEVNDATVQRAAALRREFTIESSTRISFDWNFLTNDLQRGDFAFAYISDGTDVELLADARSSLTDTGGTQFILESGFQQFSHVISDPGTYSLVVGITEVNELERDSALLVDNFRINDVGDFGQRLDSIIDTTLPPTQASNLWLRQSFDYHATELLQLSLQIRYDDGFAAFINGELVASRNAPNTLAWNSVATDKSEGVPVLEQIALPSSVLNEGENLLAIQGLNHPDDALDMLIEATLTGVGIPLDTAQFLHMPTPGRPNISPTSAPVAELAGVEFSHSSGFYQDPLSLTITSRQPEATIRYTLDGTIPTVTNGFDYRQPVIIDSTKVVQAATFVNGETSERNSASFFYLDQIVQQSADTARSAGFPDGWSDFDFSQNIIGPNDLYDGKYALSIRNDLLSIPSLSLIVDPYDLFGENGIYTNRQRRGDEWERPVSAELINPDESNGFQINAGLRMHGGASRASIKPSFRLLFRERYGSGKLIDDLFGESNPNEFDSLVLRSSTSESLSGGAFHYIRDETVRRLEAAVGNPAVNGSFVHLYLNGFYWGVYNLMERIDSQFAVSRDGGSREEYDIATASDGNAPGIVSTRGTLDAWRQLLSLARDVASAPNESLRTAAYMKLLGRNSDGTVNPEFERYLDVDNFINYLALNLYVGRTDWPAHNFYMYRRRGQSSEGFKFVVWDAEFSLDVGKSTRITELGGGHVEFLPMLLTSEDFRVRFSDRIQELISRGGTLYVNPESPQWDPGHPNNNMPAAIYAEVVDSVRSALVAESARWGDVISIPPFTRDEVWLETVRSNLAEFFPNRTSAFVESLRVDDVYRDAPQFGLNPGKVDVGAQLSLTAFNQSPIYFTTDGTDPRASNGAVSATAELYTNQIPIHGWKRIRVRSLDGTKWSAVNKGDFFTADTAATSNNLRITELHYHPANSPNAEFIELTNIGSTPVQLDGVSIRDGIRFQFPVEKNERIFPGERLLLVRDAVEFATTYPLISDSIVFEYDGSLSDRGERLTLLGANGDVIQTLRYSADATWPLRPDGGGPSLQLIAPYANSTEPENWRASAVDGGSPGKPEFTLGDANLDGLFNSEDLVLVFQSGHYEDDVAGNSTWITGDWNGDGDFTTSDLVIVFQFGAWS